MGEGRERGEEKRKKEREKRRDRKKSCLPLQKSSGRDQEWAELVS